MLSLIVVGLALILVIWVWPKPGVSMQSPTATRILPTETALISTPTPDLILNPTPGPTMEIARQEALYDLIRVNGHCELPCLLGITPGRTSLEEAQAFFHDLVAVNLKLIGTSEVLDNGKIYRPYLYLSSRQRLDTSISFHVDSIGVIRVIEYEAIPIERGIYNTKDTRLAYYSIDRLLKSLGMSDLLLLERDDMYPAGFSFYSYFPDVSTVVEYHGETDIDGIALDSICPIIGDGDIYLLRIVTASKDSGIDLNLVNPPTHITPTSNQSFMRILGIPYDEFMDQLLNGQSKCFKIISE